MNTSDTADQTLHTSDDQHSFLQKTYGHMFGAVAAFIGLEYLFIISGIAAALTPLMTSNWLIVLGGFILLGWMASYFASKNASPSMQYAHMGVTVLLQSIIFIPLMAYAVYFTDGSALLHAATVTLGIFAMMTAIVAYSGKDFSFLGPTIAVVGIAALVAIVGSVLFSVSLGFYFAVAMAVFAALVVLYETSNVINRYGPGQHIQAATGLFASVALLLYYVLSIFISRD